MSLNVRLRWFAASVFVLSSALNYMDRQLLNVLAPLVMKDLHFNQERFGWLIAAFSIAYAASALFAGWFLDRVGVNWGMSVAVALWSAAAAATGAVTNFASLLGMRALLGIGEAASVPAAGKVNGVYLEPKERALGAALNGLGISVGLALAPLWIDLALARSWRVPYVIVGLVSCLWIPLWLMINRAIPPQFASAEQARVQPAGVLRDRNTWLLALANLLWMGAYSLWTNWTTIYLMNVHGLTLQQSKSYVWIPPLISNAGGFFGGWLSARWMARGQNAIGARRKAVLLSALCSLVTFTLPILPNAAWATAVISVSFFFALAGSVNIYAMPVDLFGPARSGLAIGALVMAYGALQTVISPIIGKLGDLHLYTQVTWFAAVPPLFSYAVLRLVRSRPLVE